MHVLMFEQRFWEPVSAGAKRQTVRWPRALPIRPGDVLSLRRWEGVPYRSRQVALCDDQVARAVREILIDVGHGGMEGRPYVWIEGRTELNVREMDAFARADGFATAVELVGWHDAAHGLPFLGTLIEW
jgi:hypothetical protein